MQVLSPIYYRCAVVVARSSEEDARSRADMEAEASASYPTFSFEVDCPDAMIVSPPWVKVSPEGIRGRLKDPLLLPLDPTKRDADDSTSPGTP